MSRKKIATIALLVFVIFAIVLGINQAIGLQSNKVNSKNITTKADIMKERAMKVREYMSKMITHEQRKAAAKRFKALLLRAKHNKKNKSSVTNTNNNKAAKMANKPKKSSSSKNKSIYKMAMNGGMGSADIPHYFGPYPNWAYSPMPRGPIQEIILEEGGSDYSNPQIMIEDVYGTGSGATATATVENGEIKSITLLTPGDDYTAPVVTIDDPTGSGAAASAIIGGNLKGGIKKFVNKLPGLGPENANDLGQYIPIAKPDTITYPGCDYYEIGLVQYKEKMHSDLPPTLLRGYVQISTNVVLGDKIKLSNPDGSPIKDKNGNQVYSVDKPHYMGPIIIAKRDRPVRIKFVNLLPTGSGGNLFIPVDTTVMGAGMTPTPGEMYTQNRATLHLHGGFVPWISDGTPHQWITPAGENTHYPKGVSVKYVPDMWFNSAGEPVPAGTPEASNNPGDGAMTFYYNNQQSARLMFYHDHSYGITRLNVYAGEAAGYLITDDVEKDMIDGTNATGVNPNGDKVLPDLGIPLVIQDKTYVDSSTISMQDPTWEWGSMPPMPHTGDLWMPHVYMTAQNPYDVSGVNPFGRWHYGPWFWPPTKNITYPPIPNPYYDPVNAPWEPPVIPATPNPSMAMEAFMDTPIVNGTAYPYLEVEPKAYRFRILNACNDRFLNLQLYQADPSVQTSDGRTNTEVKMVQAVPTPGWPKSWPTDGREGGVPDPTTSGPSFIQIGTEGGFLPAPVVLPNQPVDWNKDPTTFNFGNVTSHTLLLGPAERGDVIVDFSQYAGKTLILYNDAPAAFPARDPRYDYYTGDPNQTDVGGAPPTQPGFGPNIRTIMQIRVKDTTPASPYDVNKLKAVFAKTDTKRGVFEVSQDPIIVPQAAYNSAYNKQFPKDAFARIFDNSMTFKTISGNTLTIPLEPKAIQDEMGEAYDKEYGRMSGFLGLELPQTQAGAQNFVLYGYGSPPVDLVTDSMVPLTEPAPGDGTQIWKITHNGVDTHTIHFHMFNVQLVNRVAWDGIIMPPDPNELGWKETIRVNPLEDTIVALRPVAPTQPFDVPNSVRLIDPTKPEGAVLAEADTLGGFDPLGEPVTITNHYVNYGWEYVLHCHLLGHEEMDMMHSMIFGFAPRAPSDLVVATRGRTATLTWNDNSNNETGFTIQRATDSTFTSGLVTFKVGANVTTYIDNTISNNQVYYYRVQANNVVGDTAVYPAPSLGFPNKSIDSAFSNVYVINGRPPAAPSNLAVTGVTRTSISLSWRDNSNNENGFVIYRASNASFTSNIASFTVGPNTTTFTDSSLTPNTRYYYRVRAFNDFGFSTYSNTVNRRTLP